MSRPTTSSDRSGGPTLIPDRNLRATDKQLLQKVISHNDYKAFECLFSRYYDVLCIQVKGIISCEHRAEEIVSDVFVKMWKNRDRITISSSLKAYLYTAVKNQAIDYLRKQEKRRKVNGTQNPNVPSNYISPEERIFYEETRGIIQEAIDALPPQGKYIFRLSREKGLKYKEIAEMLNISIKTVETHMRRSLIFLRHEVKLKMAR